MSLLKRKLAFMAVVNKVKGFVRNVVGVPPLTLPNAVGDDLLDYKIYGNSKQDGTPTPEAPIEIESVGDNTINLCPINTIRKRSTSRWAYQNLGKLELVPGKYTVKCHYKQYGTPTKVQISVRDYDELNTAYGYSAYYGLVEDDVLVSFTLPTTAKGIQILLYINCTADVIDTDCEFTNIMLVEGAYTAETIPDYEPFGYKVPIKVTGKNLFDEGILNEFAADNTNDTEWVIKNFAGVINDEISFKENTRYTMAFTAKQTAGNPRFIFTYTDGSTSIIDAWQLATEYTEYIGVSAVNKTIKNIALQYGNTGYMYIQKDSIQLIEGVYDASTMPDYEPYKDLGTTNIYLDEPLRKAVDIADYIDFKNKCVVRKLDEIVFDGTEDWRAATEIVYMPFPTTPSGDYMYNYGNNSISTHLKNNVDTKADGELYFVPVGSVLRVYKKNGIYTDVVGWKAFLAEEYTKGNPVTLITPYDDAAIKTEPIELPTIPTAKGTTTLTAETVTQPSNMDVTYYSSI